MPRSTNKARKTLKKQSTAVVDSNQEIESDSSEQRSKLKYKPCNG